MPILLTPLNPTPDVGPGLSLQLQSDFTGPLLVGSYFELDISASSDFLNFVFVGQYPTTNPLIQIRPMVAAFRGSFPIQTTYQYSLSTGDTAYLRASLKDPSNNTLDTTATSFRWDGSSGLAFVIHGVSGGGGGLTPTESQQLQNADNQSAQMLTNWNQYTSTTLPSLQNVLSAIQTGITAAMQTAGGLVSSTIGQIFSGKTLDLITTQDLSGGVTCNPVRVTLPPGSWYGIQVRVTTIPAWYAFTAPGGAWTPMDLAVLTIKRGGDVLIREGIHTTTREVYPLPGVPSLPLELNVPLVPPAYDIEVDWGTGVCGQVLALKLP